MNQAEFQDQQANVIRNQRQHAERFEAATNLAHFLQAKTGSVLGRVVEKMPATDQRALFGRFIGKGRIVIDGEQETISNLVVVGFGQDYDYRNVTKWSAL